MPAKVLLEAIILTGAGFRRKLKSVTGRASLLSAILLAHGFLVAALLSRMELRSSHEPPGHITYLVLPPAPAATGRQTAPPPQSQDAAPVAASNPLPAAPPMRHRKAPPAATASLRDDRRDPCGRPLRPGEKPQPGITCNDDTLKTAPLALPGSLHLDERGMPVPDRKDIFAGLPAASSEQAAADADRHFAALQQRFPKWVPHTLQLWESPAIDFCGCSIVIVGTSIGVKPAESEDPFVSP